jgi:hypothetical protein
MTSDLSECVNQNGVDCFLFYDCEGVVHSEYVPLGQMLTNIFMW